MKYQMIGALSKNEMNPLKLMWIQPCGLKISHLSTI